MFYSKFTMHLYKLEKQDMIDVSPGLPISFIPITYDNVDMVKQIADERIANKFEEYIKRGSSGFYALADDEVAGYGWLKRKGLKDKFYKLGRDTCYLGSFLVSKKYRGNNIYPAIINKLVDTYDYKVYYIAAYDYNISSLKGIKKIGFTFLRADKFIRFLGFTFFKKKLV